MIFWKEHAGLRMILMAVTFVLGMVLVIRGWMMTGRMAGLGLMLLGVALLLVTLYLYNARFADRKKH
nr:hypothetical protein [uncultured Oscillibacter sp.]